MKGLLGEQNPEKIQQIYALLDDILATNREFADTKIGTYFNYDSVMAKLQEAQTEMTETARNPRPEDLPEDIPWSEKFADPNEYFDPYTFDGSMSEKDHNTRVAAYQVDLATKNDFMIRSFNRHGVYVEGSTPFPESELAVRIDNATKNVDVNQELSGWTVSHLERDCFINGVRQAPTWVNYNPDGKHPLQYDTGRRPDGQIIKDPASWPNLPQKTESPVMP